MPGFNSFLLGDGGGEGSELLGKKEVFRELGCVVTLIKTGTKVFQHFGTYLYDTTEYLQF